MKFKVSSAYLLSTLLVVAGCPSGDDDETGGNRPNITAFAANPTNVEAGGTTMLSWTVDGATEITITAAPGGEVIKTSDASGMVTSNAINEDTVFTLAATNSAGSAAPRTVTVTVGGALKPEIVSFTATPMDVAPGGAVVLAWETENATAVDITPGVVADGQPNGMVTVNPQQTTTYTLTAKGDGMPATLDRTVTVTPVGPTINQFTANPTTVTSGETSDLSWDVSADATNVTVTDAAGTEVYNGAMLQNTVTVTPSVANPPGPATYTLVATDADGNTSTDMVTISVNPVGGPVVVSFTATPDTVLLGETSDLAWNVTGATSIEIQAGGVTATTSMDLMGTYTVTATTTTVYTLLATDGANNAMAMVTVTVNAAAPPVLGWTANPNPVALGAQTSLDWQTAAADTVRVLQGGVELTNSTNQTGSFTVTPTAAVSVYTLEVSNAIGTNTADVTVYAHAPAVINDFQAAPGTFPTGTTVTATLTWDVSSAATLTLLQDGNPVAAFPSFDVNPMTQDNTGTFSVQVSQTTTFSLVAVSAGGTDTVNVTVAAAIAKQEPNDTADTAVPVVGPVATVNGEIAVAGDVDFFSITVPANGWLRVETSDGMGGCALDTRIDVYTSTDAAANNNPIAGNDDIDFPANPCSRVTPFFDPDPGVVRDVDLFDMAAGTYYIRIQTSTFEPNDTGLYTVSIEVGNATCGNGLVETGANETCDDGNTTVGDGCDAACLLEVNPTVISGQGGTVQITLNPQTFQLVQVDLATNGQSVTATAADVGGTTCDNVDTGLGFLNGMQQLTGSKAAGGPSGAAGDCANIEFPDDAFAVNLDAGTYYVAVFNDGPTAGTVQLDVTILNPTCGDTVINPGETCDDGNTVAGDGCDNLCQIEVTGAFNALPGATQTFLAGSIPLGQTDTYTITVGAAPIYLTAEVFSDSTVPECAGGLDTFIRLFDSAQTQLGTDDLDGLNFCSRINPTDAFARLTQGTYTLTVEEFGQNAAIASYDLVMDATEADVCGNGIIDGVGEVCDDGNTTPGDGCDAACQPEGVVNAEVEPNNTFATANTFGPVGIGVTTSSGIIDVNGDFDVFTFEVPAGATLDLSTNTYSQIGNPASVCPAALGIDTEIVVWDPGFVELAQNDDIDGANNRCSAVSLTGLTAGTYYVQVRYWNETGTPATGVGNGTGTTGTYYLDIELQ